MSSKKVFKWTTPQKGLVYLSQSSQWGKVFSFYISQSSLRTLRKKFFSDFSPQKIRPAKISLCDPCELCEIPYYVSDSDSICHGSGWEFCLILRPCPVKSINYLSGVKKSDKLFISLWSLWTQATIESGREMIRVIRVTCETCPQCLYVDSTKFPKIWLLK